MSMVTSQKNRLLSLRYDSANDEYQAQLLNQQGQSFVRVIPVKQQILDSVTRSTKAFNRPVMPLETLLKRHFSNRLIHLLEVELESVATGWVYELEWLSAGHVVKLRFDAHSGQILTPN